MIGAYMGADVDVQMGPGYESVIADPAKFAAYQANVSSAPGYLPYRPHSFSAQDLVAPGIGAVIGYMFLGKRPMGAVIGAVIGYAAKSLIK